MREGKEVSGGAIGKGGIWKGLSKAAKRKKKRGKAAGRRNFNA